MLALEVEAAWAGGVEVDALAVQVDGVAPAAADGADGEQ